MSTLVQKTRYRIVLDLEAYDDLDPQEIDWHDLLKLEGDENVFVSIKEDEEVHGVLVHHHVLGESISFNQIKCGHTW